ncbi:unnamed protein product [Adineta ricciae]|uniref:G-protein coupled receptors family 1 profile domain-containing protein n=1 Tax=Adineta ricciae TaxID=249248 RepID=A0A815ZV36_ADIRI|nr:unnamed protein product [Adineta ricciae]CAF1587551.1 unnamed protein product [Adineta ricciae]
MNTTFDSNQIYWTAFVSDIMVKISQYAMGAVILIGDIGAVLSFVTLYQPALRKNPCALYYLASSTTQIIDFNFGLMTRMLQYGYNVNTVNYVSWFCKIRYYLLYVFVAIPRYFIIFASIDRYFASSHDALRRQWSSQKIAHRVIFINIIFWLLIYTHVLIFYEIQNDECLPRKGAYNIFFGIYIAFDSGILPPLFIMIFSLLTLRNIRHIKNRTNPMNRANGGQHIQTTIMAKKDLQLLKIAFNEAIMFVLLSTLNPCYFLYQAFTTNTQKSPLRLLVELSVFHTSYVFLQLELALTFFIYIWSASIFRQEFLRLIKRKFCRCRSENPRTVANERNHLPQ